MPDQYRLTFRLSEEERDAIIELSLELREKHSETIRRIVRDYLVATGRIVSPSSLFVPATTLPDPDNTIDNRQFDKESDQVRMVQVVQSFGGVDPIGDVKAIRLDVDGNQYIRIERFEELIDAMERLLERLEQNRD